MAFVYYSEQKLNEHWGRGSLLNVLWTFDGSVFSIPDINEYLKLHLLGEVSMEKICAQWEVYGMRDGDVTIYW